MTRHLYSNYFGAETTNVHDAILAYRAAWDPYVMGVLRNIGTIADSFDTVAKSPPSGYTADQLTAASKAYRDVITAMLGEWNEFAGLAPDQWAGQSSAILNAWQDTVKKVAGLVTTETGGGFAQGITWPAQPPIDVQRKVFADLSDLAIPLTGMNLLMLDIKNGLHELPLPNVPSPWDILGKIPWYGWVGIVVVGGGIVMGTVAPILAPIAMLLPKRR